MAKRKKKRAAGEGSVWPLPSGSHRAEVPLGVGRTPLRKTFKTHAEAVAWKTATAAARDGNTLATAPAAATVNDRIDAWLADRAGEIDERTLSNYRNDLARLVRPGLGPVRLLDLTPAAAKGWAELLTRAGRSADARGRAVMLAKAVLEADVGTLLPANPFARVKRPKPAEKEVVTYTLEQARSLLAAAAASRWGPLVRLALDSGMRPGELLALRWKWVDLDAGRVKVRLALRNVRGKLSEKPPKTAAGRRTVHLAPATVAALRASRIRQTGPAAASGLVFPARTGNWLLPRNVAREFERLCDKAGVPRHGFKTLRHTSGSLLIEAGAYVKAVSVRLGHASVTTTLKYYAAVMPSQQRQARRLATKLFGPDPALIPHDAPHATGPNPPESP